MYGSNHCNFFLLLYYHKLSSSLLLILTKTRPIILNLTQQALLTANYGDRTRIHRKLLPDRSDKLLHVCKWKKARFLYKTGSLLRRWHVYVLWCCFKRNIDKGIYRYVWSDYHKCMVFFELCYSECCCGYKRKSLLSTKFFKGKKVVYYCVKYIINTF